MQRLGRFHQRSLSAIPGLARRKPVVGAVGVALPAPDRVLEESHGGRPHGIGFEGGGIAMARPFIQSKVPRQLAVSGILALGLLGAHMVSIPSAKGVESFAVKWSRTSSFGNWTSAKALPRPRSGWPPLVRQGRLVQAFGWHGALGQAVFDRGMILASSGPQAVFSGPGGVVTKTDSLGQVWLRLANHMVLEISSVLRPRVAPGERVPPNYQIGMSRGTHVAVELVDRGYPVNPLKFFGRVTRSRGPR